MPQMAKRFNQYFTSIGKNLQKSILPTKNHFSDYLKDPNQNSFFIQATTAKEMKDIIMTLIGLLPITRPNSIPPILLKQTRSTVSLPLATFINNFFENGIFPEIWKLANVVPIFKSNTRLLYNNYRTISFLSNIRKIVENW